MTDKRETPETMMRETLGQRLERSIVRVPFSGCWLWTDAITSAGYGNFVLGAKSWQAHRASFLVKHGTLPRKLYVCHTCDVRACVNPEHLFLGTNSDNIKDFYRKHPGARHLKYCKKGHPMSGSNLYLWRGKRRCLACRTAYDKAKWEALSRSGKGE